MITFNQRQMAYRTPFSHFSTKKSKQENQCKSIFILVYTCNGYELDSKAAYPRPRKSEQTRIKLCVCPFGYRSRILEYIL